MKLQLDTYGYISHVIHVHQFSVIHILVIVRAAAISLNPGQLQYINYRYHSVSILLQKSGVKGQSPCASRIFQKRGNIIETIYIRLSKEGQNNMNKFSYNQEPFCWFIFDDSTACCGSWAVAANHMESKDGQLQQTSNLPEPS